MKNKGGAALVSSGEFSVVRERRDAGIPLSMTYIKMSGDSAADRRINELVARLVREGERFAERALEASGQGAIASVIIKGASDGKELHLYLSLTARRGARFISRADFDFCLSLASGRVVSFKKEKLGGKGKEIIVRKVLQKP